MHWLIVWPFIGFVLTVIIMCMTSRRERGGALIAYLVGILAGPLMVFPLIVAIISAILDDDMGAHF